MTLAAVSDQRASLRLRVRAAAAARRVLVLGEADASAHDLASSTRRALERLGHAVFFADVREWREPAGAPGPVSTGPLGIALDVFRPDAVVVVDLTLDVASVEDLARRGAAVLRLASTPTLVAPGDAGSTLVVGPLPDEDLLRRDVEAGPAVDLATFSPRSSSDRLAIELAALAEDRAFGACGAGWDEADTVRTADDRLRRARGAGIHVVLPGTDVIAQVLHAAAAGGAVLAPAGHGVESLFDPGDEVVLYDPASTLESPLRALLDDEGARESVRRAGFARLVRHHLLDDALERALAALAGVPAPAPDAPLRTVVVSGYFGAANRGDDILVATLAGHIRDRVPGAHVVVAGTDPQQAERTLGIPALDKADPAAVAYWAARASAVVLGPGGLWQDYSIARADGVMGLLRWSGVSPAHLAQLPLAAAVHGADFHVMGMGVGPLSDPEAQAVVRFSADLARSVTVRDGQSRQLLESIPGWSQSIEVAPDVAYGAALGARARRERGAGYLAVNVRSWPFEPATPERVLDVVAAVAAAHGLEVVGVPMQPSDAAVLEQWAARGGALSEIMPIDTGTDGFLDVLAGARAVVAMRLHTSLFAHRLGRPAVGVSYDPKVAAHFAELGRAAFAVDVPVDEKRLAEAVTAALAETALPADTVATVRRLEDEAVAALDRLAERLAQAPVRTSWPARVEPGTASRTRRYKLGAAGTAPLDLDAGSVTAGNVLDPDASVPFVRTGRLAPTFHMDVRAPHAGDYAAYSLPVRLPAGDQVVEVEVKCTYAARPEMRGRLAVQLLVDGVPTSQVDIADGQSRCTFWARPPAGTAGEVDLAVRVIALRDLEDWNWGPAGKVTIVRAAVRRSAGESEAAGVSDPRGEPVATGAWKAGA